MQNERNDLEEKLVAFITRPQQCGQMNVMEQGPLNAKHFR
jgi:hypothetical protein